MKVHIEKPSQMAIQLVIFTTRKLEKNVIFKKETKEFVSGWKLTEGQIDDLLTNGNVKDY